jgi:hypothetical protein
MPGKEEKKRRRDIVRSIRAHEYAQAEAGRPLEKRVLRELLDHLNIQLKGDQNMKRVFRLLIAVVCLGISFSPAIAQSAASSPAQKTGASQQSRTVKGQILTSTETPAVKLEFDKGFKYVGGHDFILYEVARAEQHFFVDADEEGRIKRMYWVQFEGYLPTNTHAYRYKVNKTANIGGLEFIADASARNIKGNPGRPDSDGARARAFLEGKGYRMASDDVMSQRLVHLVDEAKRNELMIIYMEDLSGKGLTAADLAAGGRAADQWDEISKGLLDRAVNGMKIQR